MGMGEGLEQQRQLLLAFRTGRDSLQVLIEGRTLWSLLASQSWF